MVLVLLSTVAIVSSLEAIVHDSRLSPVMVKVPVASAGTSQFKVMESGETVALEISAVQWAKNVVSVSPTVVLALILSPPSAAVNQPSKRCPS